MSIDVKRLESGYYHVRGDGPCNWSQPPQWPCGAYMLREFAFPEASAEFIMEAALVAKRLALSAERQRSREEAHHFKERNRIE